MTKNLATFAPKSLIKKIAKPYGRQFNTYPFGRTETQI